MNCINIEKLFKKLKLKEHSVYKVKVKIKENNIEHFSFLFTGFKTGGYCVVYNNSYENPVNIKNVYSIKIIKKISNNNKLI